MTDDIDKVLSRRITQCIRLPALDDEGACGPRTRASGKMILAAGRLAEVKGFDVALRAFARLGDPAARLVILGEGPCRQELAALAIALGVAERVEFPGYVTDIRPWLEAARVFLLSSYFEGYAAVVVEALDAGRPVVSTDCTPAAFELLSRPEAGAVAPIADVAGLATRLRQVMAAPAPDPQRLADMVAGYRIGPISAAYLRLFDSAKARRDSLALSSQPIALTGPDFAAAARTQRAH
jgi:glycosyltransferase involved in cell wall biosynthesis